MTSPDEYRCLSFREFLLGEGDLSPFDANLNHLYAKRRAAAESRAVPWRLGIDEFSEVIRGSCVYCGKRPAGRYVRPSPSPSSAARYGAHPVQYGSVDRIRSGGDYSGRNVQSTCADCQRAKGSLSGSAFRAFLRRIMRYEAQNAPAG